MEGSVLVEVDATVGKLSEGSLLLDFGSLDGVLDIEIVDQHLRLINRGKAREQGGQLILTYSSAMIAVV
jgi:hypothetical protein